MTLFGKSRKSILPRRKTDDLKPFADGKNRSLEEQVLAAKVKLEKARIEDKNVIEMELRNLRHARNHKMGSAAENRHMDKIKNAYYSLNLIDSVKMQINDIETSRELFQALNDLTDAVKLVNRVYSRSEKPRAGAFERHYEKMTGNLENADERMEDIYSRGEGISDLVSNEVVERMLAGTPVDDCLREADGIMVSIDELGEINFGDINLDEIGNALDGIGDGDRRISTPVDVSQIDFSDF